MLLRSHIREEQKHKIECGKWYGRQLYIKSNTLNIHFRLITAFLILMMGNIEPNPGLNNPSNQPQLSPGPVQIVHMNVCSLLPKIDLVELELSNNEIILLSETHLNDDVTNWHYLPIC